MAEAIFLGTDFGGTKIRVGAVDMTGRILAAAEVPTEASKGFDVVLDNLDHALRSAAREAACDWSAVKGIGVAAPGQVDTLTHAVIHAPNLGWVDVPFGDRLRARYPGIAIAVDNDVNAAALGEARFGAGRDFPTARDLALIFLGTGVGGGIVSNGQVVSGATGAGGEFGHMIYIVDGDPCGCGKNGHFESYAGGASATKRYRKASGKGEKDAPHLGVVFDLADKGDPIARKVVAEYEMAVKVLAANIATALNPAVMVIGGGVAEKRRSLVGVAAEGVAEYAMLGSARACKVVPSALWADSGVLGAAAIARVAGKL